MKNASTIFCWRFYPEKRLKIEFPRLLQHAGILHAGVLQHDLELIPVSARELHAVLEDLTRCILRDALDAKRGLSRAHVHQLRVAFVERDRLVDFDRFQRRGAGALANGRVERVVELLARKLRADTRGNIRGLHQERLTVRHA